MAANLIERVKDYLNDEFIHQASNSLDESSQGISKAVSSLVPLGLAGICRKATSGTEGADNVFNMVRESAGYLSPTPNLANLHNDEKGSDFSERIFGKNESRIMDGVSRFAGIKESSTDLLTTLILPVITGFLGKHAQENNLSPSGLSGFLSSQKEQISRSIPAGLSSLGEMFGLGSLAGANPSMGTSTHEPSSVATTGIPDNRPRNDRKWLLPLILIIIVICLLWYFSRGCAGTKSTVSPDKITNTAQ